MIARLVAVVRRLVRRAPAPSAPRWSLWRGIPHRRCEPGELDPPARLAWSRDSIWTRRRTLPPRW